MEEIGFPDRLERRVEELERRGQLALAEEYRQLWDILCTGLEQCARLLGDSPMELEEFAPLFRLVLSQYDVGTIPVSLDRVTAGETTRQTGHRVKVLFLLGADDSSLPPVSDPPGLLSDDDRSLLAGYGLELNQSRRELLSREMTTIYQTCARPSERLAVTWPARGPGGEERRPSFLVQRFAAVVPDLPVEQWEEAGEAFRLEAPLPALELAGRDPSVRRALERLPDFRERALRLDRAATWERGSLSRRAVERLYGPRVPMSASRMDKYKSCTSPTSCAMGLKAEPRRPAGFTAPGVRHLRPLCAGARVPGPGPSGPHVRPDCPARHGGRGGPRGRLRTSPPGRWSAMWPRSWAAWRVRASAFSTCPPPAPDGPGGGGQRGRRAGPLQVPAHLLRAGLRPGPGPAPRWSSPWTGSPSASPAFVDRVDGYVHDGKLYLRVVDYKTGRKSFDLTEVWNGLGLQMLLYLFTLEDRGQALYGLPVEGAGVLYLPAREAVVRGSRTMSGADWRRAVDRELTRSGLVLDDPLVLDAMESPGEGGYRFLPLRVSRTTGRSPARRWASAEQLGKLGRHIQRVLEDICRELAQGNIAADPFWRGPDKTPAASATTPPPIDIRIGRGGDCKRWLPGLSAAEFWEQMGDSE